MLVTLFVRCILVLFHALFVYGQQQFKNNDKGFRNKAYQHMKQADHLEVIKKSLPLFFNKTLTVCVVVREPFVIYNQPQSLQSKGNVKQARLDEEKAMADLENYSGIAIKVIKNLKSIFKFDVRISRPKDNQFGVLVPGVGWSGMMGTLVRNESDVGATALSITINRAQVVDFTRAYFVETAAILLRIPAEVQNYFAIFEPFSYGVWLVLLATIMLLIFLITIMTRLEDKQREHEQLQQMIDFFRAHRDSLWSRKSQVSTTSELGPDALTGGGSRSQSFMEQLAALSRRNKRREYGSTWQERFYYATSCVLNILLIRDIRRPPRQTPIRILVCVWWLCTIVVVNIYFGILFGQLVVPRRPKSIESLEELVGQRQVEWAVTRGTGLFELFRQSRPDSVYGQLGARMHNVSDADEGVGRVVRNNWAFIRERSMLTFKVAQEHSRLRECRMQFAREEFFSVGFGLALTKGSHYLKPFNSALTLMIENGFIERWRQQYWPRRDQFSECKPQPLREGDSLSMKHFISIYLVCSLIVLVALLVLLYQLASSGR